MTSAEPDPKPYPHALTDHSHLRLLSVFHAIHGALALLCGGGYGVLMLVTAHSGAFDPRPPLVVAGGQPVPQGMPPELASTMQTLVTVGAIAYTAGGIVVCVLEMLVARFLARRRHRVFCFVVSGLVAFFAPIGTLLGVFTILILCKAQVAEEFARNDSGANAPGSLR